MGGDTGDTAGHGSFSYFITNVLDITFLLQFYFTFLFFQNQMKYTFCFCVLLVTKFPKLAKGSSSKVVSLKASCILSKRNSLITLNLQSTVHVDSFQ